MRTTILGREALVFFVALILCAASTLDVAYGEEDSSRNRGALLYERLCANCHGPAGRPSKEIQSLLIPPPTDLITFVRSLDGTDSTQRSQGIIRAIEDGGRRNRLHYTGQLSDQQLRALADYLQALAATEADASGEDDRADPAEQLGTDTNSDEPEIPERLVTE